MAIDIITSFNRTSKALPFTDSVMSKAEMLAGTDEHFTDGFLTVCKETKEIYIYKETATPSAETGKFVLVETGGGGDLTNYYTKLETNLLLDDKANATDVYTKTETDDLLADKVDSTDVYTKNEVYTKTETDTLLDNKANTADVYTKTETDTVVDTKIAEELANFDKLDYQIVDSLPTTGEAGVRYLIKIAGENKYNEYIYVNDEWHNIGTTDTVDLSTYYDKTEVDALLDEKANANEVYTTTETDGLLDTKANVTDVYTKTETDTLLADKANSADVYTKTEADALLADKADQSTTYTKTETDTLLDDKASKDYVDTELAKKEEKATVFNLTDTYVESDIIDACNNGNVYIEENGKKRKMEFFSYYLPEHDIRICVLESAGKYKEYMFSEGLYSSSRFVTVIPDGGSIGQVLTKSGADNYRTEWKTPAGFPNIDSGEISGDKFFNVNWEKETSGVGTNTKVDFTYNPSFDGCIQMFVDKGGSTSSADYGVIVNLPTKEYVDNIGGFKIIDMSQTYDHTQDEIWDALQGGKTLVKLQDGTLKLVTTWKYYTNLEGRYFQIHCDNYFGGDGSTSIGAIEIRFSIPGEEPQTTPMYGSVRTTGPEYLVLNWSATGLNATIEACNSNTANGSLTKMLYKTPDEYKNDYAIVGMMSYEIFDSSNNRLNFMTVCQFTGQNQTELSVRGCVMGTQNKVAHKINAWVLLRKRS